MRIIKAISKLKKEIHSLGVAVLLVFHASPYYFCINCLISIGIGFLPLLPMMIWRNMLNGLDAYLAGMSDNLLSEIIISTALYGLMIVVQELSSVIAKLVSLKYGDAIDYYIENIVVDAISDTELAFFDSSELRNQVEIVKNNSNYVLCRIPDVLCAMIQALVWVVTSFVIVYKMGLWIPLVLLLLTIPQTLANKKNQKRNYLFQKETVGQERKLGYYLRLFQGDALFETKLYDLKDYFHSLYTTEWSDLKSRKLRHYSVGAAIGIIRNVSVFVSSVFTYAVALLRYFSHEIAIGDLAYFISIISQFCTRTSDVFGCLNEISDLSEHFDDINDFLNKKPLLERSGNRIPTPNPKIEFKNVSFRYPNTETDVLKDCSFVINPGEIVGLVGLNGAGKSTIVKLICRFYDPFDGQILIDDVDAREYDLTLLRKQVCALFQDYVKYNLTLRENIALSNIDNVQQDSLIWEACEKSMVSEFMGGWKKGIDEQLSRYFDPEGKELSGGQWQRISLARAFFRKGTIVLLDEPSAALDPIAEYDIFKQFTNISLGKSTLLISHRLSNITMCDTIMLLEDGRIIEKGTHKELLEKNGRYAYLFNLQASKYL